MRDLIIQKAMIGDQKIGLFFDRLSDAKHQNRHVFSGKFNRHVLN